LRFRDTRLHYAAIWLVVVAIGVEVIRLIMVAL